MNYDSWSALPNNFFVKCTSAYDNERELYDVLEMEGYNHHGVPMRYYPVSISADPLYGEDNARVILRGFDYNAYYELPTEDKKYSTLGMMGVDNFTIWINMLHFDFTSKFDSYGTSAVYPAYLPKIGDLVYARYNGKLYEIVMVKAEDEIFLQGKHTWAIQLIEYKEKGYLISSEILGSNDLILNIVGKPDVFDITDTINQEKTAILYDTTQEYCSPKDPFNDW